MNLPGITTIASLDSIPACHYVGYIRRSDESLNRRIDGTFDPQALGVTGPNPCIVEAHLYASNEQISVSIRDTGDSRFITIVNWSEVDGDYERECTSYCGIGFEGDEQPTLHFVRAWYPLPDPLCANMPVLKHVWTAFIGFHNPEK